MPRRPKEELLAQEIGARLRAHRERSDLSQEALAERAGVHRTYVGLIERGEVNSTIATLLTLTDALNTTLSTLLQDIEDTSQASE